ncbi:hypothetical protein [Candidatus Nitrosotalea okcheonensis]|uniref:Uncharacterized protein n=1 Tax=Candidatus Nitrosotalea okcheonensis TaxID=1903276 RepID=A0A2H1FIT7_9ARCH|nr:hypothetical protein [Candidatus Nitrosotalea okcheonensis]SMH72658.1 exported protein of unknown function [Candidatus Nitrosotalea okcheonensis]
MLRNQKITLIVLIAVAAITLTSLPLIYENTAIASTTVHLAIKEIPSVAQGTTFVSITDQQLSNIPSFSNAIKEADKIFNPAVSKCNTPCQVPVRAQTSPDSYTVSVDPVEAKLALSIMGFHDISRPGQSVVDIHGTVIEYGGKYYSIVIMGI